MKKIVLISLTILAGLTVLTGCERNDYKHPLHRANGK